MKVVIELLPENELVLPVHHKRMVYAALLSVLPEDIGTFVHDVGYRYGNRVYKLFTFSDLTGTFVFKEGKFLRFPGRITLQVATYGKVPLLEALAKGILKRGGLEINGCRCRVLKLFITEPVVKEEMLVRTLSPVTVHTTTLQGKTIYYGPRSREFRRLVLENLDRKLEALGEEGLLPGSARIEPRGRVRKVVTRFKDIWITGYHGTFYLRLPRKAMALALNAGLGARNSIGFGMVEECSHRRSC